MTAPESPFRGFKAMQVLVHKMVELHEVYSLPGVRHDKVLRLRRRDLDLIKRWPKTAAVFNIQVTEGRVFWKEYELLPDKGAKRYA